MTVPAPPDALIQEELARLVDSDALRRAPTHVRLLRYLVARRVAGDAGALRETSIALEVFRRDPASFDPQTDPIVRVTTGRLRDRLEAHYARFDKPPKLRIVLPKGRYAPEFVALPGATGPSPGIAVLSTREYTGEEKLAACGRAFADRLSDVLAKAGVPRVIARGSIEAAEAATREPALIGRQLGVPWLLEATLSREAAEEIRWSVRLLDAVDASVRWVETTVGGVDDVYRLADRMIDSVAVRTIETLPWLEARPPSVTATVDLPASDRSRLDEVRLLLLRRTVAATDDAIAMTTSIANANPEAGEAWAMLAAAQYSRSSFMDDTGHRALGQLEESVARALACDPSQPIALRTRGMLAGKRDWNLAEAERAFERALRVASHYTSARLNYAELLTLAGRHSDARAQLGLAQIYDPLSASVQLARAICFGLMRRYAEARDAWRLCRAAGEDSVWYLNGVGQLELESGHLDRAAPLLRSVGENYPDLPGSQLALAALHARRGEGQAAHTLLGACKARFPNYAASSHALVYAWLGERTPMLQHLEEAIQQRDMGLLATTLSPAFDPFANDPALRKLKRRCPIWDARPAQPPPGGPRDRV